MGRLIAGGDSYVWGSELSDDNGVDHSVLTWPALLADYFKYEYVCAAQYARSNSAIARHVMNMCEEHKVSDNVAVVVQWTFGGRYEFRMRYETNEKDSPWYSISTWTIEEDMSNLKKTFQTDNQSIFDIHVNHIEQAQQLGIADFAKVFYQHVGNSEYYEIYSTLKEILFLQNYLKVNNMLYLFTASNSTLFDTENFTLKNADDTLTTLLNQIDWDNWFKFPGETKPVGFYRWARENNYPLGTTHPLDDAHRAAFELIKENFKCE